MQGRGPPVRVRDTKLFPGAMDGHSGSDDNHSVCSEVPDLVDYPYDSDDDDQPDLPGGASMTPSQWKQHQMRKAGLEERMESESDEDEGRPSEDGDIQDSGCHTPVEDDLEGVNSGPGSVAMFVRLSEMANQFMQTVNEFKLQSTASRSKAPMRYPSPPLPSKKRKVMADFSPPRNAPELVSGTQEEDEIERDSLSSQTSRTPRKRLLAPWKIMDVKLKSRMSKSEAMAEFSQIAAADLAKAGPCDDYRPPADALGGFKPAQVKYHNFVLSNLEFL